tara:strand:+ start:903 stop:1079 length:177 start_codon:yes stop_codon:yes gene_type:complete
MENAIIKQLKKENIMLAETVLLYRKNLKMSMQVLDILRNHRDRRAAKKCYDMLSNLDL